ncbi:MAG: hypothetical protein IJQ71_01465 [Clostridia bacterium]|nr:hypothetical protein [Clostridia bacterium]
MENMNELNLEQMEQVSGGTTRTINTGNENKAAIRRDPWIANKPSNWICSLANGTVVETLNDDELYYDAKSKRNFVQIKFVDKYGTERTGYVAASLVGLPR